MWSGFGSVSAFVLFVSLLPPSPSLNALPVFRVKIYMLFFLFYTLFSSFFFYLLVNCFCCLEILVIEHLIFLLQKFWWFVSGRAREWYVSVVVCFHFLFLLVFIVAKVQVVNKYVYIFLCIFRPQTQIQENELSTFTTGMPISVRIQEIMFLVLPILINLVEKNCEWMIIYVK